MSGKESRHVFQCRQCGECCAGRGGIFVRPEEVVQMAAHLGLTPEEFSRRYVAGSSMGPHLACEKGICVFLKDNCCQVHPVKPFICRQWPFLPALLVDAEELEQAKGACPGIDPDCSHEEFIEEAQRVAETINSQNK
jgi:Fe-S-cluster containining protein